jgi:hypothetical protein
MTVKIDMVYLKLEEAIIALDIDRLTNEKFRGLAARPSSKALPN